MEQKYVFAHDAHDEHYTADVFAVRCFDNRFWKTFKRFVKHLGLGHIDTESVAGGAKVFASPDHEADREFMLRELAKSIKFHHTKRAMLFTHEDCGAYGGSPRFKNYEEELAFHRAEHEKVRSIIKQKFPEITVETYFIDKEGVIKTSAHTPTST